ncbi:MAG: OmpA family protein [Terracidiphilus sp.]
MASIPLALGAQDSAKPAAKAPAVDSPSRWDIFAGYSYLDPHGSLSVTTYPVTGVGRQPVPAAISGITTVYNYDSVNLGGLFSVAYYFNRYVGAQMEVGFHEWGTAVAGTNIGTHGNDDGFTTVAGGIIYRYPTRYFTPFVHALGGGALVNGPYFNPNSWGPDVTVGGGLDYETSLLHHRLAIRILQADYEHMDPDFGASNGGNININALRLSTGAVLHLGSLAPPEPVTLACSASPVTVFPGDPVTVTSTAGGLNPKLNAVYTWSGSGVTGSGTTASVATGSLAAGSYTVNCGVKEGQAGKEGLKPWESASASTSFTVKPFEPPTINCSANPGTIKPGETSTITAIGVSPQNRPLTYIFATAVGAISGSGATATFSSTGAPAGTVGITCTVSDDKGQTATANTSVTITVPYVAPVESPEVKRLEARLTLHSIFFPTDQPRIGKPKGGLVASQEGTLTTLATDFKSYLTFKPDAHLTLTGHTDVRASVEYNQALSERRVARTKQFLVEQGVPEASIETRGLGKEEELSADQVKELVEQNPDLSDAERGKVLHELGVIVLAQNRRVDVTLSTTGQESVRLYPFNAADSLTLLDQRNLTSGKKAAGGAVKKPVPPVKKKPIPPVNK